MARVVICVSCGKRLDVGDDWNRPKMRCPDCGVMSEVPEASKAEVPPAKTSRQAAVSEAKSDAEAKAAAAWLEQDPYEMIQPARSTLLPPPVAPRWQPDVDDAPISVCRECGEVFPRPAMMTVRVLKCPVCNSVVERGEPPAARPRGPVECIPLDPEIDGTHDDDGNPYDISSKKLFRCPDCFKVVLEDVIVCPGCGVNFDTGELTRREYEKLHHKWVAGMTLAQRVKLFVSGQVFALLMSVVGVFIHADPLVVVVPWIAFAGLTAFLLGTFDEIMLSRTRGGRVELSKLWRVCFIKRPIERLKLGDYAGVATAKDRDAGVYEWFVFVILFLYAAIPGLLWLYMIILADVHVVLLTNLHGGTERVLYRSRNLEQAMEMSRTLVGAAGLRQMY